MAPEPTRHFVSVAGRWVHYARAGSGPAVVLLHGSPQSHRALLPLMRLLSHRFTVLAFDTPGFGASDPLPVTPGGTLAPFADALVAALRALGLPPVPVYGTHTGAGIALEAANRHPDAVTRAVLDGFGIWSAAEQEDMLREYLPAYAPVWDGGHLVSLWSRVRDAAAFFPFFRRGSSARRDRTPDLLAIQAAAMDMLRAGPGYGVAYAASIRHDPAALAVDPARVRLLCREDDMLLGHLDRLPPGFPATQAQPVDGSRWAAVVEALLAEAACAQPPPPAADAAERFYAGPPGAQVHVRRSGTGPGRPLVLLHDNPGSGATLLDLARSLPERPVLLVDTPGSGLSDPLPPNADGPAEAASRIAGAIPAGADRAGVGTGGTLAGLVGAMAGAGGRVALIDPPPAADPAWIAAQPFDAAPDWGGGHLLAAWYRHRDALLHGPWFDRRPATARVLPAPVDLDRLQRRTVATLEEAGPALCRALLHLVPRGDVRLLTGPDLAERIRHWQGT